MKATIAVDIKPFKVPSFAYIEAPTGDDRDDMKVSLHMLSAADIDTLAHQFREDLFEKAGIETFEIRPDIRKMAAELHASAKTDLTEEQYQNVESAKCAITEFVKNYGEEGKIALSLCAADFAAE